MSEFKKGDRVRVSFVGEVSSPYTDPNMVTLVDTETRKCLGTIFQDRTSVEKIETFGPGDFVRAAETGQLFYLGRDGYMQVEPEPGQFWSYDYLGTHEVFTSDEYERVTLVEPPL